MPVLKCFRSDVNSLPSWCTVYYTKEMLINTRYHLCLIQKVCFSVMLAEKQASQNGTTNSYPYVLNGTTNSYPYVLNMEADFKK